MKVKAQAKWVRMSPRKIRRIINLVKGRYANEALTILKYLPHRGARVVEKTLKSAIANAKNNYKLAPNNLKITEAYVDSATALKRWQPRSKGRAFPILKRSAHVTVCVEELKGD